MTEQITTTSWNARTDPSFGANVSPTSVFATTTPSTDTPISPATRATAVLIAHAIPALRSDTRRRRHT
jgi:hypothetical protein